MTAEIYARVAPYLTIYSVAGEINPAKASERVVGILRQTDFGSENSSRSPGIGVFVPCRGQGL